MTSELTRRGGQWLHCNVAFIKSKVITIPLITKCSNNKIQRWAPLGYYTAFSFQLIVLFSALSCTVLVLSLLSKGSVLGIHCCFFLTEKVLKSKGTQVPNSRQTQAVTNMWTQCSIRSYKCECIPNITLIICKPFFFSHWRPFSLTPPFTYMEQNNTIK